MKQDVSIIQLTVVETECFAAHMDNGSSDHIVSYLCLPMEWTNMSEHYLHPTVWAELGHKHYRPSCFVCTQRFVTESNRTK